MDNKPRPLKLGGRNPELNSQKSPFEVSMDTLKGSDGKFELIEHLPVITMEDVEKTLNLPAETMAKTILLAKDNEELIAVILPGLKRVNIAKVARALSCRRQSLEFARQELLEHFNLQVGKVSPFCGYFAVALIDKSLVSQESVYCGSGDPTKTVKISPLELIKVTNAIEAEVT